MMLASMATLLMGLLLTFLMNQSWQLIIIWGIIIGLGSSLFLTVLSPYVANHWFKEKRGLATGILTASTAMGQLILLPVLAASYRNLFMAHGNWVNYDSWYHYVHHHLFIYEKLTQRYWDSSIWSKEDIERATKDKRKIQL